MTLQRSDGICLPAAHIVPTPEALTNQGLGPLMSRHIVLVVPTPVLELQKHDDEDENDDDSINENKILI
ncbi:MAG: hypothetical protein DMG05_06400 [Acidobacteria bacterium]|nr:MAG: hypothetical protein DMG05_06400 [Acidobacteriota bacterium]